MEWRASNVSSTKRTDESTFEGEPPIHVELAHSSLRAEPEGKD